MATVEHDPEWPDKILLAAILLMFGGALGSLYALADLSGATINAGRLAALEDIPALWVLCWSAGAFLLGLVAFYFQAWIWAVGGAVAAILSGGFFGFVPILGISAIVAVILGSIEGEEMRHDEHKVGKAEWPDKSVLAGIFLTILGIATLFQSGLAFADRYSGPYFADEGILMGVLSLVVAVVLFIAGRNLGRLQTPWLAYVAATLGLLLVVFWILGPLLGVLALLYLFLAEREGEFTS